MRIILAILNILIPDPSHLAVARYDTHDIFN
jgi:hypothetical protein